MRKKERRKTAELRQDDKQKQKFMFDGDDFEIFCGGQEEENGPKKALCSTSNRKLDLFL
jgi:hypothetical protein